jgi:Xaa-Pro dipeptidase
MTARIARVQDALRQAGLDGWLFYDFRLSDPIAYRVLELSEHGATTRRWFCFVPSRGPVRTIVSAVEAFTVRMPRWWRHFIRSWYRRIELR